ncbi:MAG: hypothetical protein ACFFCS_16180 [Candidatus Hodarchaeota archaeon]
MNVGISLIFAVIALVTLSTAAIIAAIQLVKLKTRSMLFMFLGWISVLASVAFESVYTVLNNQAIYYDPIYTPGLILCFIAGGYFLIFFMDSINHDRIDAKKLFFFTALSTPIVGFLFAEIMYSYPLMGTDLTLVLWGVLTGSLGILFVYYFGKIYHNAPKSYKTSALISLIGVLIMGILSPIIIVLGLRDIIPGINLFLMGLGALLVSISFALEPLLVGILPFRVLKLTVLNKENGIMLYTHVWGEKDIFINDELFTGMVQGIRNILEVAIKGGGDAYEIKLDDAILVIAEEKDSPYASVLVTRKSSRHLREALRMFSRKFDQRYKKYLKISADVSRFGDAHELIDECFSFIPE